jgi:DNA topoisomerase-1
MSASTGIVTPYLLDYGFTYLSTKTTFSGWKCFYKNDEKDWGLYLDYLDKVNYQLICADEKIKNQEFHYNEAQLIRKLEKQNIGRPSTFTNIVESIEKYTEKGKIKGKIIPLTQYELKDTLKISHTDKQIEEENKLSITPLGKQVSEFCHQHFESLFDYKYTERMEEQLDLIERGNEWKPIVSEFIKQVDSVLQVDAPKMSYRSLHCGLWKKNVMVIKDGPYGYYLEYKKELISLNQCTVDVNDIVEKQEITEEQKRDIMTYVQKKDGLKLNENMSIKKGPRGYYLFYKKPSMKKPKFYNCDDVIEMIEARDTENLLEYIQKKYKLI